MNKLGFLAAASLVCFASNAMADNDRFDLGQHREHYLHEHAEDLFGVSGPVKAASTVSVDAATAEANPLSMVTLARSLRARVVSSAPNLGANTDMMALWPNDTNPTHLIVCNEQGPTNPGVQRVRLSDGLVETILTGTSSCDPAHRTAWGTIVVAEEAGSSGNLLEIIDPLHTTNVSFDRNTGALSGANAGNVALRRAVGHLSFEGVGIYPNGVMYYGDENRPSKGTAGGAYFKFIPSNPWNGSGSVSNLSQSPLVDGRVYGLRLGKNGGSTDYGQGTNTGMGEWILLNAYDANLRAAAASNSLTGYYRPEDIDIDAKALANGQVRFCANNTGNEEADHNWGETICITDGSLVEATANTATPNVQYFNLGTSEFAMMDNIAYQPGRGNWMFHEDRDAPTFTTGAFNDSIWLCLEDGADADTLTEGCIRVATLNDLKAESTGGLFDASGKRYYFSVQHNVTGHGTILEITGWR
jgi:hypothetical protein